MRFNTEKEIAGKKWYYKFMKDNPCLSLRMQEATSMARVRAFNKDNVYIAKHICMMYTNE